MIVEEEHFLWLINTYGADNVLAINFDNTARIVFTDDEFDLATMYVPQCQSIMGIVKVTGGKLNEFLSFKPINTIQSMVFRTENTDLKTMDSRMLSN